MGKNRSKWRQSFAEYWQRQSAGERSRFIGLTVLACLALAAWPTWKLVRPWWTQWRVNRALAQAHTHAENENYRGLLLSLQRAAQLAPGDAAVWRETADYLADLGLPDTLTAYENLVRLGAGDDATRYELANQALRFNAPERARSALAATGADNGDDVDRHRLAATIALRLGEPWIAATELQHVLARVPDDAEARFNLAVLQLNVPSDNTDARATLLTIVQDPTFQVRAALALVRDAARRQDAAAAANAMQAVLPARAAGAPPLGADALFEAFAARLREVADDDVNDAVAVARWLGQIRRGEAALAWLETLPESQREQPELRRIRATLALQENRWDIALPLLADGALGPLQPQVCALALAARQQSEMNRLNRAEGTWSDALDLARTLSGSANLLTLAQLAQTWRNAEFATAALEAVLARSPNNTWVRTTLARHYMVSGQRGELQKLVDDWRQADAASSTALLFAVRLAATGPGLAAAADLDATLVALPDDDAVANLARVIRAERRGDIDTASATWNRIPESARSLPEFALWGAVLAQRQHDTTQAAALIKSAAEGAFFPEESARMRELQRW